MSIFAYHFKKLIILLVFLSVGWLFFPLSVLALGIGIHVPEKYTEVQAGDRFYFEMEIRYPENPARKDLQIEYNILENGRIIATSKFLKAVETQASFMDYVVIPDSAKKGMHEIDAVVTDYGQLNATVSASFRVAEKDSEIKIYFYVIIGFIFLFGLIISWEINRLARLNNK
jgi:hypothetical protein